MKTKLLILFALVAFTVTMTGCTKDDGNLNTNFELESEDAEFDGENLRFGGSRKTVVLDIATEDATGKWETRCLTDDLWLSFSKNKGKLKVTVDDNNSDAVRESYITIILGDTERTINVSQDYIRVLRFATDQLPVGALADTYQVGLRSNVKPESLTFEVVDENMNPAGSGFWLSLGAFENGEINFSVTDNDSFTKRRTASIIASGEGEQAELVVVQNKAGGQAYIVSLDALDFYVDPDLNKPLIYEVWDETANKQIGLICREYLFKATSTSTTVRNIGIVAYTIDQNSNKPDHANGRVIANMHHETGVITPNGGTIRWNNAITHLTAGSDMIASYTVGAATEMPDKIYLHPGSNMFSFEKPEDEDMETAINAVLKPWELVDRRVGPANNMGDTEEEYKYRIVKIGVQYWFADNLKTTRFKDGTNILTDMTLGSGEDWPTKNIPMCCIHGIRDEYAKTGATTQSSSANANTASGTSLSGKNEYGVTYNMFTSANLNIGENVADEINANDIKDAISPDGWKVPVITEFEILANYVGQLSSDIEKDPLIELQTWEDASQYGNVTRFDARGRRYRTNTGGGGSGTHYATLSYVFTSNTNQTITQHKFKAFHMGSYGTAGPYVDFEIRRGAYIRCLKAD